MSDDAVIMECPSCSKRIRCRAELRGKRAKCGCGATFDVPKVGGGVAGAVSSTPVISRAGTTTGAGTASAAGRGPSLSYSRGNAGQTEVNEERSRLIKHSIIFAVVAMIGFGGMWALKNFGGKGKAAASLGEDAMIEQKIYDESGTEAHEWLKGMRGRMLSGMTDSQAEGFVSRWYDMGVKKVYAFGGVMTMSVALELPPSDNQADKDKRTAIFERVNKWHEGFYDVPQFKDVGQKYLLVRLKL